MTATYAPGPDSDSRLAGKIARLRVYGVAIVLGLVLLCSQAVPRLLSSPAWRLRARPVPEITQPAAPNAALASGEVTAPSRPASRLQKPLVPVTERGRTEGHFVQMARRVAQLGAGAGAEAGTNLGRQVAWLTRRMRESSETREVGPSGSTSPVAVPDQRPVDAPAKAPPTTGLVLLNSREAGETIQFVLNGRVCFLRPGEKYESDSHDAWLIQFHRGGDFGNAQYNLSDGSYVFHSTDHGWELSPFVDATP